MPIRTLLVANRGEIASRIISTARGLGIRTVAVFSDVDVDAPFAREADEAVRLPGAAPKDTYLHIERIVEAAVRTGADAIHPGYGFLSENAIFARACDGAGLIFVGPPAAAIEAMGSKTRAKELMAAAGVPVLRSHVLTATDEAVPELVERDIGYPLLVKASFGGGGRGMRIVRDGGALADAVESASREAESAFGDGAVFLERYIEGSRHVEVQLLGDQHGDLVALFERDCSIQRRYQKIVEEAPSPAVDDELRERLAAAAVAAGRAIGYENAGTVEFLLAHDRSFYFLEVNTRLQVEHPVTEMITGLDLVELQLLVAEGHPLPSRARAARIEGHAVEARLYAEDVGCGFLPASGTLQRFRIPAGPGVRVDSGVEDGSSISVHYDSMIAKVIAHGHDRATACARLRAALAGAELHGPPTNRDLLVAILDEPEFLAGGADTAYLERHDPAVLGAPRCNPEAVRLSALAVAVATQHQRRSEAQVLSTLPSGWRNIHNMPQRLALEQDGQAVAVGYRIRGDRVDAVVNGEPLGAVVSELTTTQLQLEVDGRRRRFRVRRSGDTAYVDSPLGSLVFSEPPRFPHPEGSVAEGSLLAPMPATVTRVQVAPGDHVKLGATILVLEAMKMEHAVQAPRGGVVGEVRVKVGQQVDGGAVLAVLDADGAGRP